MRFGRRQFLKATATALAGAFGLGAFGFYIEPRRLVVERVSFPIADLPAHLNGFTIGVLADLHIGAMVPVARGREAAERLARLKPDLVVVAGDMTGLVDSTAEGQRLIDEAFAPVQGAYGVLGNWDYFHHELPMGVKRQQAVRMLVNQGVLAAPGLWLAGLDDGLWGQPDLDKALAGAPAGAVRILLAHEPDLADLVQPRHRVALQISGHTHGGQVRLPFYGPLLLPPMGRKYVAGLYQAPACQVYTTRGLGMTQVAVRFWCPPEITLITLTRQA